MIEKSKFKDLIVYVLVFSLFILAAILIYPLGRAIIYGILLGYIFYPIYKFVLKRLKYENVSAFLVCLLVVTIFLGIMALLLTSILKQGVSFYLSLQDLDFSGILESVLPTSIYDSVSSTGLVGSLSTSISNLLVNYFGKLNEWIIDLPSLALKLFVVFFVFFFSLKDGEKALDYLRSLSPLKKETHDKFFTQFKEITNSVLVGQIVIGIVQGIVAGIGYFIFDVQNALFLTMVSTIFGVIPIIGPWLVWIPVDLYLFTTGNTGSAIGILIYGTIIISGIDNLLRPVIVSRQTKINSGIILIGMIGGLFVFGLLGLIIGPLILSYILLVMELYRKKDLRESNIIFVK